MLNGMSWQKLEVPFSLHTLLMQNKIIMFKNKIENPNTKEVIHKGQSKITILTSIEDWNKTNKCFHILNI